SHLFLRTSSPQGIPLVPYPTLFRSPDGGERVRTQLPAAFDQPFQRFLGEGQHRLVQLVLVLEMPVDRAAAEAGGLGDHRQRGVRSEEHTSELSHVKISYAVFCLKTK